ERVRARAMAAFVSSPVPLVTKFRFVAAFTIDSVVNRTLTRLWIGVVGVCAACSSAPPSPEPVVESKVTHTQPVSPISASLQNKEQKPQKTAQPPQNSEPEKKTAELPKSNAPSEQRLKPEDLEATMHLGDSPMAKVGDREIRSSDLA